MISPKKWDRVWSHHQIILWTTSIWYPNVTLSFHCLPIFKYVGGLPAPLYQVEKLYWAVCIGRLCFYHWNGKTRLVPTIIVMMWQIMCLLNKEVGGLVSDLEVNPYCYICPSNQQSCYGNYHGKGISWLVWSKKQK